jgi:hypothetical protein
VPDQIDIVIADLDRFTRGEIVALAMNMDANLRESPPLGTPIDTGWARANWVPSLGAPVVLDAKVKDPTPAQVSTRQAAADSGLNDVLSWKKEDGPIFIANNVPYIGALNNGHSPQSPRGFVQNALEKAVRETNSRGANQASRARRGAAAQAAKPRRL